MKLQYTALLLSLLMGAVIAAPVQSLTSLETATRAYAERMSTIRRKLASAFDCLGQSCVIADIAGSTGKLPTKRPAAGHAEDAGCILKHNPALAELNNTAQNEIPTVEPQQTTWSTFLTSFINDWLRNYSNARETGEFTGKCAPNILLFAKGTLEPGRLGLTIGPQLTSYLPGGWSYAGIDYDPDIAGDYCLGLPGGMVATATLESAFQKCPSSRLYISGYSQGAMVVRNGVAHVSDIVRDHIKGVITIGDPFNGAPIKDYAGPLEVYCAEGDGVCAGNFAITAAHVGYIYDGTVAIARRTLFQMAMTDA